MYLRDSFQKRWHEKRQEWLFFFSIVTVVKIPGLSGAPRHCHLPRQKVFILSMQNILNHALTASTNYCNRKGKDDLQGKQMGVPATDSEL